VSYIAALFFEVGVRVWSRWWGLLLVTGVFFSSVPRALATTVQCAPAIAEQGDPEPLPPGAYLLRVHPSLGLHEVLVIEEFAVDTGEVTRRYRRQVRRGLMAKELEGQTPRGADWHFSQVRHIARRVLAVYKDRKRFSPAFLEGYEEDSRRYINDTEYVEVRDGRDGPLVAANRFVLAPYALISGERVPRGPVVRTLYGAEFDSFREPGETQPDTELPRPVRRLPEAHYLDNMDLPLWTWTPRGSDVPCGLEVEMGAYLVEQVGPREQQEIWKSELWVQLLRLAHNDLFDDGFNYNGLVIYSFGDLLARKIYEPLGFERLSDKPVIAADGERWWPLIYFVHSLDKASAKAAEGQGAWLQNGAYFKSRLATDMNSYQEFNPSSLPAWDTLLKALESSDEMEAVRAATTLVRFAELQAVHYETLLQSRLEPSRANRALASYRALDPIMNQMEEALTRLVHSPNYSTRYHVSNMVPGLVTAESQRRNFLKKGFLLRNFICDFLADPAPIIPLEIAYALRNDFTYSDILTDLGEYWPEFDGPTEFEAMKARALKKLHEAGLKDPEIDEVVAIVHRGMTRPMFVVDSSDPRVSYQKCSHIQVMGLWLNKVSRGNPRVVENLLILAAARHSVP
jgi:hypothetical protein